MKPLEEYPEILTIIHIREYLGIGRDRAYEIFRISGFPALNCVGTKKRVRRDAFEQWLKDNPEIAI